MNMSTPDDWIDTEELIARLPPTRATLTKLVRSTFGSERELPAEIPVHQAVALAAVAQAHARGAARTMPIYELVSAQPSCIDDSLVVLAKGSGPKLVAITDFSPVPAMVLDLPELRDAVVAGLDIVG